MNFLNFNAFPPRNMPDQGVAHAFNIDILAEDIAIYVAFFRPRFSCAWGHLLDTKAAWLDCLLFFLGSCRYPLLAFHHFFRVYRRIIVPTASWLDQHGDAGVPGPKGQKGEDPENNFVSCFG